MKRFHYDMNLALFFEGTGQGVRGKRTNVSLVHDACVEDVGQRRHLEPGPGARVGALLLGRTSGVGWRAIFARARRWYEACGGMGQRKRHMTMK